MTQDDGRAHLAAFPRGPAVKIRGALIGRAGWMGGYLVSAEHPRYAIVRPYGHGRDEKIPWEDMTVNLSRSRGAAGVVAAAVNGRPADAGGFPRIELNRTRHFQKLAGPIEAAAESIAAAAGIEHIAGLPFAVEVLTVGEPAEPEPPIAGFGADPSAAESDEARRVAADNADALAQLTPAAPATQSAAPATPTDPTPPAEPATPPAASHAPHKAPKRGGWVLFDKNTRRVWVSKARGFEDWENGLDAVEPYADAARAHRARSRIEYEGARAGTFDPHGLTVDTIERAMEFFLYAPPAGQAGLPDGDPFADAYRAVMEKAAAVKSAEAAAAAAWEAAGAADEALATARQELKRAKAAAAAKLAE